MVRASLSISVRVAKSPIYYCAKYSGLKYGIFPDFNYEYDAVMYEHDQAFSSYSISHYQGLKGIIKIDTISRL